jgi:hypothetical protein
VNSPGGSTLRSHHQVVATALNAISRSFGDVELKAGAGSGTFRRSDGPDVGANSHTGSVVRISPSGRGVAEVLRSAAVRITQSSRTDRVGANEATSGTSVRAMPPLGVGRAAQGLRDSKVVVAAHKGVATSGTNSPRRISGAVAEARIDVSELIGAREHHLVAVSNAVGWRVCWSTWWGWDRGRRGRGRGASRGTHRDCSSPPRSDVLNQNDSHGKISAGSAGCSPSPGDRSCRTGQGTSTNARLLLHLGVVAKGRIGIVVSTTTNTDIV